MDLPDKSGPIWIHFLPFKKCSKIATRALWEWTLTAADIIITDLSQLQRNMNGCEEWNHEDSGARKNACVEFWRFHIFDPP